ncbi:MAG: DUF1573 domain-containing protein [Planctomycetota bacterium]
MAWQGPSAWLVAVAALAVGSLVGAGGAALRATLTPWRIGDLAPVVGEVPAGAPRAEVPETRHEFGRIGTGAEGSHRFAIRNTGGGPLTLSRGHSSCTCTVSDFDRTEEDAAEATKVVPAGEATVVTVTWKGKPPGGPFRQQVTVLTDDPRRPEIALVVEGTVVPTWRAVPESIVLANLSASGGQQAATTVYTFGPEPPAVKEVTIDHPQAAEFFSLATAALSAEEIAAEPGASGGFRIEVAIRPGLPLGRLRQTISATFTMPEEITATVPLEGNVGGDLVLAGPGWDSSRQALVLGTVSGKAGLRTRIFLTAKGPHRDRIQPTVEETVPAALQVTVGPGSPVGTGGAVRIPLEIVIPSGSRGANHMCSEQGPAGRIVLATGHPDSPTLSIPVCVAIGP